MAPEEALIFEHVMDYFKAKYPYRRIQYEFMYGDRMISIDGEIQFNLEGYNLLYNLTRLCKCLEDELR